MSNKRFTISFFILWFLLFSMRPVYAYLDAGTGSIILQILLGGLAGLAVVLKLFWRRILKLFGIKKVEKESIESTILKPGEKKDIKTTIPKS